MKVAIGSPVIQGPFGGGNLFVKNLNNYLKKNGNEVVFNLKDRDIDIILMTNPIKYAEASSFNHYDIAFYCKFINQRAIVVHRINECDERKDTDNVNGQIIKSNKYADYTIYVSEWIKKLYENLGIENSNSSSVIYSGSDELIFNNPTKSEKILKKKFSKLQLVTHHWSSHWKKGFEIYSLLDRLLDSKIWSSRIEFTYIGNIPNNFQFKNTKVLPPKTDLELGVLLKSYDGYITASLDEPSGNHHIEAAQSGLPILYIKSGGIPEYCDGYGLEFTIENFEEKLDLYINNYDHYKEKMILYPFNATTCNEEYANTFQKLLDQKEDIIKNRVSRNSIKVLMSYLQNASSRILFNLYLLILELLGKR
jgi:hypothetical protein